MFGLTSDSPESAVEVLKKDHDEVEALFDQFDDAKDESNMELKAQIVAAVCKALTIHAQIEEEIFYPALRREDDAQDLVDEAAVEHQTVKNLVAELQAGRPGDELYDAKVQVLSEYVKHHVKEEEGELFPLARKADLDLDALGRELLARKEALAAGPDAAGPNRRRTARNGAHKAPARRRTATKTTTRKSAAHGGRH